MFSRPYAFKTGRFRGACGGSRGRWIRAGTHVDAEKSKFHEATNTMMAWRTASARAALDQGLAGGSGGWN
jgi:hypothetical protein